MILSGLGTSAALSVIERTRDRQLAATAAETVNARAIDAFREKIAGIASVEDFVGDYEVYSFVMKAFDLEDHIFGKAMVRTILEGDIADKSSMTYRMTDPRFRELYQEMGFTDGGATTPNTIDAAWQQRMVDRFVQRSFINTQGEGNEALGNALEFDLRAGSVNSWYDVLKNKQVASVLRTALGLPDSMATLDLDRQIEIFESKMDLAGFKDPAKVKKLERQYAAIADATGLGPAQTVSPIVQLMQTGSSFTPMTLDIAAIVSIGRL